MSGVSLFTARLVHPVYRALVIAPMYYWRRTIANRAMSDEKHVIDADVREEWRSVHGDDYVRLSIRLSRIHPIDCRIVIGLTTIHEYPGYSRDTGLDHSLHGTRQ
jgi:hypothetical protein